MNKYKLYQTAYGDDLFWREWWYNPWTGEYLTLSEYEIRKEQEDMNWFQLVYPEHEVQKKRKQRSHLPGFQEIVRWSARDTQAALLWWECGYDGFQEKLAIETWFFDELDARYNFPNSRYLAELFVRPDQQGRWLWHGLLEEYIGLWKQEGKTWILTRTTSLKPNPQQMFLKAWFEKVWEYGPNDPRKRQLFYLLLQ